MSALDQATVTAVLEDWRTAAVSDRLRAALRFLEAMTLRPTEVTPQMMRELKTAGLNDRAIREAAYVGFLFNTLDRLADSLDFTLPSEEEARAMSGVLLRFGYGLTKLPG